MTEHRRTARTKETYRKVSNSNPKVKQPPSTLEMASVRALKPDAGNARTHSKKQIKEIANSIARFGYINPVIVDDRSRIVAGHARAEAAKLLGLRQVPVIRLQHLSEVEIRAYRLADNKLAQKAGWDRELLYGELAELEIALPKIGLDLNITGFEPAEVDSIINDLANDPNAHPEEIPRVRTPRRRLLWRFVRAWKPPHRDW